MLCLRVDGTMEEICVTEISQISSNDKCTYLLLKDGREISVDKTPVFAIKSVARSYYSYDMSLIGKIYLYSS